MADILNNFTATEQSKMKVLREGWHKQAKSAGMRLSAYQVLSFLHPVEIEKEHKDLSTFLSSDLPSYYLLRKLKLILTRQSK